MFFNLKKTLYDLITSQDNESVFLYVKKNKGSANSVSKSEPPIVSAILNSNIEISNFLLDNDANPMIISDKNSVLHGQYVMQACFFFERFSILELLFLHAKCGREVSDYFYKTNEVVASHYDELVFSEWLPKLAQDFNGYYDGGNLTSDLKRLNIVEKRIAQNTQQIEFLTREGAVKYNKAILNFKWLIDFLSGLRNEYRRILAQENLKKLDNILNKQVSDPENKRRLVEELDYSETAVVKACEYINEANISINSFLSQYKENKDPVNDKNVNPIEIIRRMSEERSSNRSSSASSTEVPIGDLLGIGLTGEPTTEGATYLFSSKAPGSQLRQRKVEVSNKESISGQPLPRPYSGNIFDHPGD